MKNVIILLALTITGFVACTNAQTVNNSTKVDYEECSNLYPFQGYYIDLENNNALLIDGIPATDFKTCSKYAHRFQTRVSDSVNLNGRTFVIDKNKDKLRYKMNIYEAGKFVKSIPLPVENPIPEVHEYYFNLFSYKNDVIMFMQDMYTTHFLICKYNSDGEELMRTKIEHTFVTHPDKMTNYYHPYLYFYDITASQLVFSSSASYSEKDKTVVMSLDDFTTKEYESSLCGIILDEQDQNMVGFISKGQKENEYLVQMNDNSQCRFEIEYGNPSFSIILKDNFLYVANYHPISTGSSLYCFDIKTGNMIWEADVLQVNASHSEYSNTVILSSYKDKIIMEGFESYGNYLQIFDAATGKRLAKFGDLDNLNINE